jgi:2-(1,2-epoxy-1,2-dihydrophenyl)acetyl-CoA isomerase
MPIDRTDEEGGIVRLTINKPERLNALDVDMRQELIGHLRDIRGDEGVRCLILTGAGGSFCSGADVSKSRGKRDVRTARHMIRNNAHQYITLLNDLEIPVIAAVRGNAAGVGWSIALTADFILAADNARFTAAFGRIGLAPDGGLVWHLARATSLYVAKDIVFTTRTVHVDEALQKGLVTRIVPDADLMDEAMKLARSLAAGPTFAVALAKKQIHNALLPSIASFLEWEALMQPALHTTDDSVEGASAFREKRKAKFTGR